MKEKRNKELELQLERISLEIYHMSLVGNDWTRRKSIREKIKRVWTDFDLLEEDLAAAVNVPSYLIKEILNLKICEHCGSSQKEVRSKALFVKVQIRGGV